MMRLLATVAATLLVSIPTALQPARPLVLVIDSNSPIEDANLANELLDLGTRATGVPTYQLATYGMRPLTVFGLDPTAVPSEVAKFMFPETKQGFVSLTIIKAAEIVSSNEAV